MLVIKNTYSKCVQKLENHCKLYYKNIDFSLWIFPNFTFLDMLKSTYIVLNTYQNVADLNVSN